MIYIHLAMKMIQSKNELHLSNHASGISLLEVMIVLILIGIMGAAVAPNLSSLRGKKVKTDYVASFEECIHRVRQNALLTGKVQQLFFDFQQYKVIPKIYDDSKNKETKHDRFSPSGVKGMDLDKNFEVHNFYIQGKDEVTSGVNLETVWFYIMPDASSQDVVINFMYDDEHQKKLAIKINPFYARVSVYDEFQTP